MGNRFCECSQTNLHIAMLYRNTTVSINAKSRPGVRRRGRGPGPAMAGGCANCLLCHLTYDYASKPIASTGAQALKKAGYQKLLPTGPARPL